MSNLNNLSDALFDQLNRLNTHELQGEDLKSEIQRSSAITNVAKEIISAASLQLDAAKLTVEYKGWREDSIPSVISHKEQKKPMQLQSKASA